ncbi:MAG: malate synthase A, partial [Actinobacteria bacterium]|nr:malate synthase A [Actinomycetota bacterium]
MSSTAVAGVSVKAPDDAGVLTPEALELVAALEREFGGAREELLAARVERQQRISAGELPDFLEETRSVREGEWQVAPVPADLQDRRVEITGPTGDRKMVINALNSGARMYMADFEDANSPTWENVVGGQLNLTDAIERTISVETGEKSYSLNDEVAVLLVRPRGWHLAEKHVEIDGRPVSASLFDFGVYLQRNAERLLERGSGPYFYLPKLESHREARLWNDVFRFSQDRLGLPQGTIKATVLIETILAAFEMEEILYELRDHSAGLNAGRWDYIFSAIKKFRDRDDFVLPDRAQERLGIPHGTIRATCLIETLPAAFEMEEILYELRDHAAGLNAGRWDYIFSAIKTFHNRPDKILPDRIQVTMTVLFMRAYTELLVRSCHKRSAHAIGGMAAFIPTRRDPEANQRAMAAVHADKKREAGDGFDGTWVAHPGLVPIAIEEMTAVFGEAPNQKERLREDVEVEVSQLTDFTIPGSTITESGVRTNVSVAIQYIASW